jgi:hypothetical protein
VGVPRTFVVSRAESGSVVDGRKVFAKNEFVSPLAKIEFISM